MENPYSKCLKPSEHFIDSTGSGCQGDKHDAWNEGSASRDAEVSEHHVVIQNLRAALIAEHKKLGKQAEIVSELVDVLNNWERHDNVLKRMGYEDLLQRTRAAIYKAKRK